MESLFKIKTPLTPQISFDGVTGILELSGRSLPEVALNTYKPLLEWLDAYLAEPLDETLMVFRLSYFNTSSSKYIMEMLKKMEVAYKNKISVKAIWYCEDDDIHDLANDYKALVDIPMEIHQINNEEEEEEDN